jgi:hypothetical protein
MKKDKNTKKIPWRWGSVKNHIIPSYMLSFRDQDEDYYRNDEKQIVQEIIGTPEKRRDLVQ